MVLNVESDRSARSVFLKVVYFVVTEHFNVLTGIVRVMLSNSISNKRYFWHPILVFTNSIAGRGEGITY